MLRSFTVTTLSDDADDQNGVSDGLVSLREAITAASTNAAFGDAPAGDPDGDEIAFDAALVAGGGQTLTLGHGQLLIADEVTLTTPERVTIDAADASRHFLVTTNQPVVLEGVALRDGSADGGGAVRATNANLTLRDVGLFSNTSGSGNGGAVLAEGGLLQIEDGVAFGNTARNGGVVATVGTAGLVITGSRFTANTAAQRGGGVSVEAGNQTLVDVRFGDVEEPNQAGTFGGHVAKLGSGTLTINRSVLVNSSAGQAGGGVWVQPNSFNRDATLRMRAGTTVNAAFVTSDTGVGGGIALSNAVADIAGATLSFNSAASGGGLDAMNCDVTIASSAIEDNSADRGGGLYFLNSEGVVSQSSVLDNGSTFLRTSKAGGGAYVSGFLSKMKFGGTDFTGNDAEAAGGIAVEDRARVDLLNGTTVSGNTATAGDGGGVAVLASANSGGLLNVSGSTVSDNEATGRGGGIAVAAGRLTALNSFVTGNLAAGGGGGIDVATDQASLLRDTEVTANETLMDDGLYAPGGGVRHDATDGGRLTLANAVVANNFGGDGGGIASVGGGLLLIRTNSRVEGNKSLGGAAGTSGGGIYKDGGTLSLAQTTVASNLFGRAGGGPAEITQGGGIAVFNGVVALVNSAVSDHRATFGGGIYANGSRVVLTNSDVGRSGDLPGNAAEFYTDGGGIRIGDGGGIYQSGDGSRLTMRNARIVGNEAAIRGGGVSVLGAVTVVSQNNTRIAENVVRPPINSGVSLFRGGGLAALAVNNGPTLSFSQTSFVGNVVDVPDNGRAHGGGLAVDGGSLTLVNSLVQENSVESAGYVSGGGIYAKDSNVLLQRTTLGGLDGKRPAGNVAESTVRLSRGGGMDVDNVFDDPSLTVRVVASTVNHNEAVTGATVPPMGPFPSIPAGGGISVVGPSFVLRGGSVVADNEAAGLGGGLFINTGAILLRDSRLERNVVSTFGESVEAIAAGGGAYLSAETAELFRMTVEGNESDRDGGGFAMDGGEVEFTESTVIGNAAAADGGGLGNGGGVYRFSTLMTLTDSVISGNTPDDDFEFSPS